MIEYKPDQFETVEDYYDYLNSKTRFKGLGLLKFVRSIVVITVLLLLNYCFFQYTDSVLSFLKTHYTIMNCSEDVRVKIPEGYSIGSNTVKDVLELESDKYHVLVYEVSEEDAESIERVTLSNKIVTVMECNGLLFCVKAEGANNVYSEVKMILDGFTVGGVKNGESSLFDFLERIQRFL